MKRIQRISLKFKIFFVWILFVFPIIYIISWMYIDTDFGLNIQKSFGQFQFFTNSKVLSQSIITPQTKIFGFLVSIIPSGISMFILYSLIKLFDLYAKGIIFTSNNVRLIQHIGYALLLGQVLAPVYEALMSVVWSINNPIGQRYISISFTMFNLSSITTAFIIIVVSWIMNEGCKLKEQDLLTI